MIFADESALSRLFIDCLLSPSLTSSAISYFISKDRLAQALFDESWSTSVSRKRSKALTQVGG